MYLCVHVFVCVWIGVGFFFFPQCSIYILYESASMVIIFEINGYIYSVILYWNKTE